MTNKQINIAIAEACGWKEESFGPSWYESVTKMPDYCNDLNAMHEAEKELNADQMIDYSRHVGKSVTMYLPASRAAWMDFRLIHVTAAQRAEAFLRTLGKWEE